MRKVILINKPFQYSILGYFSCLSLILISIFYSTIWYFFYNLKKEAASVGLPPDHVFFTFINEQKGNIDKVFIVSSIVALVVILLGGLILSHRVAGPLYRLTQHLRGHNKNNITPVKFRKGDYFPEIEEAFNDFLKK
jgi:hypothetical protein